MPSIMAQGKKTIIKAKLCPPALKSPPSTKSTTAARTPNKIVRKNLLTTLHMVKTPNAGDNRRVIDFEDEEHAYLRVRFIPLLDVYDHSSRASNIT